ncbi:DEAD/DEAH box helicase family protein [Neisseria gonorrhoeae]|uniref:DEAD/DEAH box helicase family protein n=2 Tax=Neisseria gonorrhoeae TaxID=485 RepID=UPI0005DFDEAF|nr:DEAD/DEAH box helicase family protein [Neisseria gonorrhoeae]KLS05138.1 type III restriction enzyme [Neisseria gonorrhoeae ATL_2011_01_08]KLS34067.1 type III restriction enzyme [Neisseria gonorrhoeae MIA_2011_03-09]KLS49049.1 type III restriction enzyme [Neisseria gonorrhoeae MIA_2011_03-10]KLT08589.1 type III restriction enzyme [Neisseria gonorrhoeae MU_NG26]MBT8014295.1 DEAD/DEAH box helicase family protein [Neisseria gonorrhoeae]
MANNKTLFDWVEDRKSMLEEMEQTDFFALPEFVSNNLKYPFFEWQKSALENFVIFDRTSKLKDFPDIKNRPTHLLFNMATGAGKTMMIAALILYYFEKGYRHFLFFVNKNNIVYKTENNFIDPTHPKFLFTEKILQGDTVIPIRKVETFSQYSDGIEIKFTSIQKLYNDIHTERENQTTLADLHELNLVMLGDEAHHLNAQTKGKKQGELDLEKEMNERTSDAEIERKGWEHMVAAATVSEKQLIGRGVRYFPFAFEGKQPNKRKFDNDMQHELRILEELFYYTHDEQSRYITELKNELRKDGYLPEKDDDKVLATFKLKSEFADNKDFRELLIWANKKIPNPNAKSNNADSLQANPQTLSFQVHGNQLLQETQFTADENDETARQIGTQNNFTQTIKMSEMERHIFNKALHIKGKNSQSLFHFDRLQSKLDIQNRNELQNKLLKDWQIEFLGLEQDKQVRPDDKLAGCLKILEMVEKHLNESDIPFIGTKEFTPKKLWEIFGTPKQKWVKKDDIKTAIATQNDWYVMDNFAGTGLEEALIQFISARLGDLKSQYDVHLIRNEEVFKLNNFADGEGFMPDFVLLLKDKQKSSSDSVDDFLHYQIFIEPKGGHLVENDSWKEAFLKSITVEYGRDKILQKNTPHYRLIGLPFFTDHQKNGQFTELFPLGAASLEK